MRYNFTHDDLKECPFCGNTIYVEVEKKIVHDEAIEKAHQEFLDYIQYLIDHPQPNRNIHDFESED